MEIGSKLKQRRIERGLTQQQVADKMKISRQTLSNWENNRTLPDIVSILLLSDEYQQSLDDLLKGDAKIMKKLKQEQKTLHNVKLIRIFGFSIMILALIICLAAFGITTNTISYLTCKIITFICLNIIFILSIVMNWKESQTSKPLWIRRQFGYGWSLNIRNKWGLIITIVSFIAIDILILLI